MDWIQIISTVGFPIACVVALAFYIYKVESEQSKQMTELKEAVSQLKVVVEHLTSVIEKMNERMVSL